MSEPDSEIVHPQCCVNDGNQIVEQVECTATLDKYLEPPIRGIKNVFSAEFTEGIPHLLLAKQITMPPDTHPRHTTAGYSAPKQVSGVVVQLYSEDVVEPKQI